MSQAVVNDDGKLERKFVVSKIKKLRREWQDAVGNGTSLENVRGSVGLILSDISTSLVCNHQE